MKHNRLFLGIFFLAISGLVHANVYFAPVKAQADLQSDDSIQIVIAHPRTSSGSYVYILKDYTSKGDGSASMSCNNMGSYSSSSYWKNGTSNYGRDTFCLPNLSSSSYYPAVFRIKGDSTQIWGYHGGIGGYSSTMYTYSPYTGHAYIDTIGTFKIAIDSTRLDNTQGNATLTRTNGGSSYIYFYGSSYTQSSTSMSYHFQFSSSSQTYYRLFRRVYHPTFDYKEINGNDVSNIEKLIVFPNSNIYTFKDCQLPTPIFASDFYAQYFDLIEWRDEEGNVVGVGGETMDYSGWFDEDQNFTFYYRAKRPVSISGYADYVLGELSNYATMPETHVALINDSVSLSNITLRDSRYRVVLNYWKDASGKRIGVPGDTVKLTNGAKIYPDFTVTPYHFTFDPQKYSAVTYQALDSSYMLTLPTTTWVDPTYAERFAIRGWYNKATKDYIGMPGERVKVYDDMDLVLKYLGSPKTWFVRVTCGDSLRTQRDSLNVILLNNYSGTWYAARSQSTPAYDNTSYYNVMPNYNYYYTTNLSSSYYTYWNDVADKPYFSIDLNNVQSPYDSYNNNTFVWHITNDSNTYVWGHNGYWGGSSTSDYLYTYQKGYSTTYDNYIRKVNISFSKDSALIEWAQYDYNYYRYLRYYNSSYYYPASRSDYYTKWRVFRQAYQVTYEMDDEIRRYGYCQDYDMVIDDGYTLPAIQYTHNEFAAYVDILGWYDENDELVGMPGDPIAVDRNMNLHLLYEFKNFYHITFDAKDHGSCDISDTTSLLPFELPAVIPENGYYFKGWVSQTTDEVVGQAGTMYPVGAYMLTADDNLYAVYEKAYEILEWGANSMTVEFLYSAKTVETKTSNGTLLVSQMEDCKTDTCVYTIPVHAGDMMMDEGNELSIVFKDGNGNIVSQAVTHVPAIVSGAENLIAVHDPAICRNIDLVILDGGVATASSTPFSFQNIRIQGGGKLVIPNGTKVSANNVYMRSGTIASKDYKFCYPQMVVNGTLNNVSGKVNYECVLNEEQYYNLTIPCDVDIADITYIDGAALVLNPSSAVDNALWIAYYDGATRATGASGWKDFAGTTLQKGIGYTVSATPKTVRPVGGKARQRHFSIVRFPMVMNLASGEPKNNISVSVTAHPSQTGKDNDAGWNLVGNPYLANYGGAVTGLVNSNGIGLLVDDGLGGYYWSGNVRYVVLPNDNGTSYSPLVASASQLPAFKNFFVQIGSGDALGFNFSARAQNTPMRMLYAGNTNEEEEDNELMVGIKVTRKGETERVGILIGEQYTDDYEINADLEKVMLNRDAKNNVAYNFYAVGNKGGKLAFIAVNDFLAQSIALGYIVPDFGTITVAADDQYDLSSLESLTLYDKVTRKTTDLLKGNYSYSFGSKEQSDNRFILSVIRKQPAVVTDLDAIRSQDKPMKVLYQNHFYILRDERLYDVQGGVIR